MAAYGASKAALPHLGEGLALDYAASPIRISTILPGYIRTAINVHKERMLFEVDVATGGAAILAAVAREPRLAYVPCGSSAPLCFVMRCLPFGLLARATHQPL